MIIRERDGSALVVTAEDADDLLALRRVIRCGHAITGSTTRVLKRDRDYSRPDKGERVKITASITVEKISLDGTLERLRVNGTVSESNNDSVPHGAHHSLSITAGTTITITKTAAKWSQTDRKILRGGAKSGKRARFVLVAIDTSDCAVGVLSGTHLEISPNIYSGRGGKRYKTSHSMEGFFDQAAAAVNAVSERGHNDQMILFGPGNAKNRFANHIRQASGGSGGGDGVRDIKIVEGIDSSGEDGIHTFTKSEAMREAMAGSKLARVSGLLDTVIGYAHKKIPRYAMGYDETLAAARAGAIDSLIFADAALQRYGDEQGVVDLLNMAESAGADVYGVDASTDIGLRASGLGGIVALLRYAVR